MTPMIAISFEHDSRVFDENRIRKIAVDIERDNPGSALVQNRAVMGVLLAGKFAINFDLIHKCPHAPLHPWRRHMGDCDQFAIIVHGRPRCCSGP